MADLGDISVRLQGSLRSLWTFPSGRRAIGSQWNRPDTGIPNVHGAYYLEHSFGEGSCWLSGNVAGNQADFTQVIIRIYKRATGRLVGEARPAVNGTFSVRAEGPAKEYYAIALDPVGGEEFNALIFDRITTV